MAAPTEATLTNNDSLKQFLFRAMAPINNPKSQPVIAFPLVNVSSANTPLFRFIGPSEELKFSFALFDDGTDVSNGTHSSTVQTVPEQIQYLRDTMFTENFDVDVTLSNTRYYPSGVRGVITFLDCPSKPGAVGLVVGTMTIRRGRIGDL